VLTFLAPLLGTKLNIFPGIEQQILLVLKVQQSPVHQDCDCAPGNSIVSAMASRGRHMRYTPQLPLGTPEADPKKNVRRRKTLQEGTSAVEPGISDNFHHPPIATPIAISHFPITPFVGVSIILNFGSVPVEFSPPSLRLEGEILVTPPSPEVVLCFSPRTAKYFPTPGYTTPPLVRVIGFTERETLVPSNPVTFSSHLLLFPFPLGSSVLVFPS